MSICRKAQQIEHLTTLPRKQMVCTFVPMQAVLHVSQYHTRMQMSAANQAPDLPAILPTKQLCCVPMQAVRRVRHARHVHAADSSRSSSRPSDHSANKTIMLHTHADHCNYVAYPCRLQLCCAPMQIIAYPLQ